MSDKVKKEIFNSIGENVKALAKLFPSAVKDGEVDFTALKEELGEFVEVGSEKYDFTWNGKQKANVDALNDILGRTLKLKAGEGVNEASTENIYIEGDNLEALKLLRRSYYNRIKMIYMDPPYNAGSDLIYKNKYEMTEEEYIKISGDVDEDGGLLTLNPSTSGRHHTTWLNMMFPRIKVARDLLTDDGCLVIAIDDNELINITKVADSIFGEDNRIGVVTIVHKPEGRNQDKYFAKSNEFALFYAKDISNFLFNSVILDDAKKEEYEYEDEIGRYKLNSLITKNRGRQGYDKNLKENNPKNHYPLYVSRDLKVISIDEIPDSHVVLPNTKTQERTWRFIKESLQEKIDAGEIVAVDENGEVKIHEKYREDKGQLIKTHWIDTKYNYAVNGTAVLSELMGSGSFDFPKSVLLMEDIIKLITNKDSIVLDVFSGSATTAHAVMNVNASDDGSRKFINVQLDVSLEEALKKSVGESQNSIKTNIQFLQKLNRPLYLSEIGKERIRRAGAKIAEENRMIAPNLDVGFRVFKIANTNIKMFSNEIADKEMTLEMFQGDNQEAIDFNAGYTDIDVCYELLLRHRGISLSSKIEKLAIGERTYMIADSIVVCLDQKVKERMIEEIAELDPLPRKFIFRDSSFGQDISLKRNAMLDLGARIEKSSGETKKTYRVEFI